MMDPVLTIVVGVTVLTVVGIASGGAFLLRILAGDQGANALQKSFFRAGHAHAGVLVTLGILLATLTAVVDGSPAELVESGAITRAFDSRRVHFDPLDGIFRLADG